MVVMYRQCPQNVTFESYNAEVHCNFLWMNYSFKEKRVNLRIFTLDLNTLITSVVPVEAIYKTGAFSTIQNHCIFFRHSTDRAAGFKLMTDSQDLDAV